jgi:hypothetical protein
MVTKKVFLIVVSALFLFNIATFICMSVRLGHTETDTQTQVNNMKDIIYVFLAEDDVNNSSMHEKLSDVVGNITKLEISLLENINSLSLIDNNYEKTWNNFNILFGLHAGEWKERWVETPTGPTLLLED